MKKIDIWYSANHTSFEMKINVKLMTSALRYISKKLIGANFDDSKKMYRNEKYANVKKIETLNDSSLW